MTRKKAARKGPQGRKEDARRAMRKKSLRPVEPIDDRNLRALLTAMPDADADDMRFLRRSTRLHVHIDLGESETKNPERELQAWAILNLLPRMFEKVSVAGANPIEFFPENPEHARTVRRGDPDAVKPRFVLALSDDPVGDRYPEAHIVYVDNRGWTAFLSTKGPCHYKRGPPNPIGAFYAGVRGCGEIFNRVFAGFIQKIEPVQEEYTFDLVTLQAGDAPNHDPRIDDVPVVLDDVAIIGMGAVGMAIAAALGGVKDLRGDIRLIDHEPTEETNEGRYMLAFPENRGDPKANIAWSYLKRRHPMLDVLPCIPLPLQTLVRTGAAFQNTGNTGSTVHQAACDYGIFQRIVGKGKPMRFVVAAVDSAAVRRDIQFGLHETVLNVSTLTDTSVLDFDLSRHKITGENACCACLYHKRYDEIPGDVEMAMGLTGWSRQTVQTMIRESAPPLTGQQLETLRQRLDASHSSIERWRGHNLHKILRMNCGEWGVTIRGEHAAPPVSHVPALAGAHVATQIVLDALGKESPLACTLKVDTLTLTGLDNAKRRRKETGCLCQDKDVQEVYDKTWGIPIGDRLIQNPEAQ